LSLAELNGGLDDVLDGFKAWVVVEAVQRQYTLTRGCHGNSLAPGKLTRGSGALHSQIQTALVGDLVAPQAEKE
jgi:hypothetical protein